MSDHKKRSEYLSLRVENAAAMIEQLVAENAQKTARIAELETAEEESDAVRMGMAKLLTGVANALRGDPPELTSWSWHDLPERAAAAINAITVMEMAARDCARMGAELEAATRWRPMSEKPVDESDPVIAIDGDGIIFPAYWSGGKLYAVDRHNRIGFVAWLPIPPFEEPKP